MEIPEVLRRKREIPPEYQELLDLYDAYDERFVEFDWDDYCVTELYTDEEIKEAIRECLEKGIPMKKIRPEWYGPLPPPWCKL